MRQGRQASKWTVPCEAGHHCGPMVFHSEGTEIAEIALNTRLGISAAETER